MIEENYETYKETYFHIFPASNLEAMAKELHAALVAYQKRLQEFEAFQQNVERVFENSGLHTEILKIEGPDAKLPGL